MSRAHTDDASALWRRVRQGPLVADRKAARAKFADLRRSASGVLAALLNDKNVSALLHAVADHSPFLWRLASAHSQRLAEILIADPDDDFMAQLAALATACANVQDEGELMKMLRRARQRSALVIALADLGGLWSFEQVTAALTAAADAYVSIALDFLLRRAIAEGRFTAVDPAEPQASCGMVVLALGKQGAGELNYSSDVDLVVFYDPEVAPRLSGTEPAQFFVRITRALARILSERTGDGYVLRVDLRLRPDPGSTSVAVSLPAALGYYEMLGQNWERAAMIKARPIAGETRLGEKFLEELQPFIWRRYFDYAAIADIHAMKRQIHAVRGHAEVTVPGHDVKLGRGGIREVEFFVQTQQLIFGGRRTELRGRRTLDMLQALASEHWVSAEARDQLTASYLALRRIEHRLQMIADEQTQRLPSDDDELNRFVRFCGYASYSKFEDWITHHFRDVERHYARLFEHAPGLDSDTGSLVFTGVVDDPETLETLERMGFRDAALAAETVRGWHFGRRAAVQSARAREVLTELVPDLLESLSRSGDPDAALAAFDAALGHMPAAVELFSILRSNKELRDLFGDVLGCAPRLAAIVARTPHVLDAVIDPRFFGAALDHHFFASHVSRLRSIEADEEFLDAARLSAQEDLFGIGVRVLSGAIDAVEAGPAHAALADCLIDATVDHVRNAFSAEYGTVSGGRIAVLAMGKLGSREMTATSDLDLVVLYDFNEAAPNSNGRRALHAVQYYTRLTQRIISALTVATRRGPLYEVDMRLRPSGKKGPLAVQLSSFIAYQREEAETWEHMALTRARPISGDASLIERAAQEIASVISRRRDPALVAREILEMRQLIAKEKGDSDRSDIKTLRGGLIDIEFIAQFLQLAHASAHPDLPAVGTADVLRRAGALGLLDPDQAERLLVAHRFYTDIVQVQRVVLPLGMKPDAAPAAVRRRIAAGAGLPDERRLDATIEDTAASVARIFDRVFGERSGGGRHRMDPTTQR
ncbi:MAG: bifunctional [glutamine synthetase] adenylyltransferase/[glutamine synthetase]-adenylyl-L-tyrosine phosphorylase [Hyphomicrobiales bacterium]|nr:bifunctional [glutamine synthetase] adenylyltransferase/[glutamine synthetase]-adenylyl-L-tyrosine phosphorylase [Hyphomicrobiales bacterium]